MRLLLFLLIIIFCTKTFSIENYKLISENDLSYLFDNSQKKWNETIVFLDKKKSLSKFPGGYDTYFLKSYFDKGSVLIMPYEFDFIDDDLVNLFLEHYYSFNIFCAKLSKNESYLNIEIKRCN